MTNTTTLLLAAGFRPEDSPPTLWRRDGKIWTTDAAVDTLRRPGECGPCFNRRMGRGGDGACRCGEKRPSAVHMGEEGE